MFNINRLLPSDTTEDVFFLRVLNGPGEGFCLSVQTGGGEERRGMRDPPGGTRGRIL